MNHILHFISLDLPKVVILSFGSMWTRNKTKTKKKMRLVFHWLFTHLDKNIWTHGPISTHLEWSLKDVGIIWQEGYMKTISSHMMGTVGSSVFRSLTHTIN